MKRKLGLLFLLLPLVVSFNAAAQIQPQIEIGSIVSLTYMNSQSEDSPLRINDGDGTFLNQWVLFLGARINEDFSLYAEVQTNKGISFVNYGLSAIYQPQSQSFFNIEVGKFLVPFGTFLSRRWASENPLIDFPLIYEYQSALSAFDLPQSNSELLRVRGQGQSFQYHDENASIRLTKSAAPQSGHIPRRGSGLRILSRQVYLTGAQVFGEYGKLSYNLGVTNGALSNPSDINNSSGAQLLGRIRYNPIIGLDLGASFAWGSYLDEASVQPQLRQIGKSADDFRQTALGLDLSYSIGHLVFFSETILNRWESPFIRENLDAVAFYAEVKYTVLTRFYLTGRFSAIYFSDIQDPADVDGDGRLKESWEYDVDQTELGLGYRLNRNALFKVMKRFNRTHAAPGGDPKDDLLSLQAVVFF